ncbi:hypothetical protein K4F52_004455 [Lecanicillium sp. MT-2017a]|nr:hypothetical protein K4F52_004455 [Lecanicillium sp. MT-2017a]
MDMSRVERVVSTKTHRLFRYIKRGARLDQVIVWGESKGGAIIIWSTFKSKASGEILPAEGPGKPARRILRFSMPRARDKGRNLAITVALKKYLLQPSARMRKLGYTRMVKVKDTPGETVWHIVNPHLGRSH